MIIKKKSILKKKKTMTKFGLVYGGALIMIAW